MLFRSTAVSANGKTIVGTSVVETIIDPVFGDVYNGSEPFIWTAQQGMRKLSDVLISDLGLNLSGWRLRTATGISADGLTIVGMGLDPSYRSGCWIVQLPEPTSISLMLIGVTLFGRKPRAGEKGVSNGS